MGTAIQVREAGDLDFLSLGRPRPPARSRRDPVPQGDDCSRSTSSGGEYNVAANLADCFGLKTGIATAMVDYPIGELVAERVRAMGVTPFYKRFEHDGVTRAEHRHRLQRPRPRRARRRSSSTTAANEAGGAAQARRLRLERDLRRRRALVPLRRHLRGAVARPPPS